MVFVVLIEIVEDVEIEEEGDKLLMKKILDIKICTNIN